MAHVGVSNLAYAHPGGDLLFSEVSFRVSPGQHVGLVGTNGVGKSTLVKVLVGELAPDEGDFAVGGLLGYMPQDVGVSDGDRTVRALLLSLAPRAMRRAGESMLALEGELEAGDPAAGMKLGEAIADWSALGGYELEGQWDAACRRIIQASFAEVAERPARTLSGGERKQLVLDVLFASDADVLLLDEPDNFLDVPAKLALERRVRASKKTILMISHDREVLAGAVGTIVTLEGNGAWVHGGSYATYAAGTGGSPAAARGRREALARGGTAAVSADEDVQGARSLCARLGQAGRRHGIAVAPVPSRRSAAVAGRRPGHRGTHPRRRLGAPGAGPALGWDRRAGRAVLGGDSLR